MSSDTNNRSFADGLQSVTNRLANIREASATNGFVDTRLSEQELKSIYKTGLYSKLLKMRTGAALRPGSLLFSTPAEEEFFETNLAHLVKEAARYQYCFGRGVIALCSKTGDQSMPLEDGTDPAKLRFRVFDDTLISVAEYRRDLLDERYYKPHMYIIRGHNFHWTRIIDFSYLQPIEEELHEYEFGGIPEPELIYRELINDAVVQRASGSITDKISSVFYKLNGFKENLMNKQDNAIVRYFAQLENLRSVYGAGLIDKEDDILTVTQHLTGFKDIDESSLRRVAMVTGVPMPFLMGENVRGLNASGDTERQVYNDNIKSHREDFIIPPINIMFQRIGFGPVKPSEATNLAPDEQANYEGKIIDNALKMAQMGGDFHTYLEDKSIVSVDAYEQMFEGGEDFDDVPEAETGLTPEATSTSDPDASLNGAQVTAMVDLVAKVKTGELPKGTAEKIFATAFPITEARARDILSDVEEGSTPITEEGE